MKAKQLINMVVEDQEGRDSYNSARLFWKTADPAEKLTAINNVENYAHLDFDNLPWTYRTLVKEFVHQKKHPEPID